MEKLTTVEVTHETNFGRDLVYVYTQPTDSYKEHPLFQKQVEGSVLYDSKKNWNGMEFIYEEKKYQTVFNEKAGILIYEPAHFIIDVNDLGIFGIESINAVINNSEYAKLYIKEVDYEEKFKKMQAELGDEYEVIMGEPGYFTVKQKNNKD